MEFNTKCCRLKEFRHLTDRIVLTAKYKQDMEVLSLLSDHIFDSVVRGKTTVAKVLADMMKTIRLKQARLGETTSCRPTPMKPKNGRKKSGTKRTAAGGRPVAKRTRSV